MATRTNLDQVQNENRNPPKVSLEDEPIDLIEANDPDEASDPIDPEGSIMDPVDSNGPPEDQIIEPIEPNDSDAISPVNRQREIHQPPNDNTRNNVPVEGSQDTPESGRGPGVEQVPYDRGGGPGVEQVPYDRGGGPGANEPLPM